MTDLAPVGRWLLFAGLGLAAVGALVWAAARLGLPLGRLPGDIRIERPGVRFYFPLGTMVLVSLVLTLLVNLWIRLFKH